MTSPTKTEILTFREVAAYLRCNRVTLYRLIREGKGPSGFKVGSDWRFRLDRVDEWMRTREVKP